MNYFRLSVLLLSLSYSSIALAIPNVWSSGFGQGWQIYKISNKKITLEISCNDSTGDNSDHYLSLQNSKKVDLFTKPNHILSFLINNKAFEFETNKSGKVDTKFRNAANYWRDFIRTIHKARKIEVYYDDEKIIDYQPRNIDLEELQFMPEACSPLFDKEF